MIATLGVTHRLVTSFEFNLNAFHGLNLHYQLHKTSLLVKMSLNFPKYHTMYCPKKQIFTVALCTFILQMNDSHVMARTRSFYMTACMNVCFQTIHSITFISTISLEELMFYISDDEDFIFETRCN